MEDAVERVRPNMMTVAAIMAGLLPIMWSTGAGSEIMQRVAVPMIGGMISSTLLAHRHPGNLRIHPRFPVAPGHSDTLQPLVRREETVKSARIPEPAE
jgi:hypothetical protein